MKKLLMELIGTFFFVLTVAMTGNALAISAMLMAWVYIGAYVSGGHYNPLLSLAVALTGKLSWKEMGYYWLAQILGGVAAYAVTWLQFERIIIPQPHAGLLSAFIFEVLLAFVFGLVVLTVATSAKYKESYIFGFAIGFTVLALGILGSPISGGLFNPAIALGANIVGLARGMEIVWSFVTMYVGGALLGGFLAAHAYRYFIVER